MMELWPFTNFHDLNLDWIIKKIRNVEDSEAAAKASEEAAADSADRAAGSMGLALIYQNKAKDYRDEAEGFANDAQDSANSISDVVDQVNTNTGRIDTLVANAGDTDNNAELLDIRVGYNGVTYPTAGDAVRGQVSDLQEEIESINNTLTKEIQVEQGYYAMGTGLPGSSTTWCRTKILPKDIFIKRNSDTIFFYLLAYSVDGEYIGAWRNNNSFDTSTDIGTAKQFTSIDLKKFSADYPDYLYALNFYKLGTAIDPDDIYTAFDIKLNTSFWVGADIKEENKLTFFPVKTGEGFSYTSNTGETLGLTSRLELYDIDGHYVNYYGMSSQVHREMVSTVDFYYIAITGATVDEINVTVEKESFFDKDTFSDVMRGIGENREDIINSGFTTYMGTAKAETETVIKKYNTNLPVDCDAFFAWFTDAHNETARMQSFAQMVDNFGSDLVPLVLNTGDTVTNVMSDGITWYNDIVSTMSVPVLNMVGNHDAYVTNGVYETNRTLVYNEIIAPFVSTWNVIQPSDAQANGYCYYYKELSNDIRLIVLDCIYWDATQKAWFESVLTDAKNNGKAVLVADHAPFPSASCTMVDTVWNTGWLSRDSTNMSTEAISSVNTFINAGGMFIAWLQGHVHGDEIVTVNNGQQLAICNNSFSNRGTKVMKTDDPDEYNYNSCTVVAIDNDKHYLKLLRIGANISMSGRRHNGFVWDYVNRTVVADW